MLPPPTAHSALCTLQLQYRPCSALIHLPEVTLSSIVRQLIECDQVALRTCNKALRDAVNQAIGSVTVCLWESSTSAWGAPPARLDELLSKRHPNAHVIKFRRERVCA